MPVFSNTTGEAHAEDPKKIAQVLGRHLAKPVQFVAEIEAMHDAGARVFIEVGPRGVLTGLTDQILRDREHLAVSIDRPGRPGLRPAPAQPRDARLRGRSRRGRAPVQRAGSSSASTCAASARQKPPPPAGTWLIDGGSARPADAPVPVLEPVPALAPAPRSAGHRAAPAAPPATPAPPAAAPATPPSASAGPSPAAAAALERARSSRQARVQAASRPNAIQPSTTSVEEQTTVNNPGNGLYAPPGADRVADVMARYQLLMQQFLETERAVMLGYLGAAGAGTTSAPARAPLPAPALAAPPLPAPAARRTTAAGPGRRGPRSRRSRSPPRRSRLRRSPLRPVAPAPVAVRPRLLARPGRRWPGSA